MSRAQKAPDRSPKIPIYRIEFPITGTEAIVSVAGDLHFGMRGVDEDESVRELSKIKKDVFRVWTGDISENSLKTSIGHNYDIAIPDPEDQKEGAKRILKKVMQYQLGGKKAWEKHEAPTKEQHTNAKGVGVGGNHEYRTRKLTGQWLDKEMYSAAKILPIGMEGIVELIVTNKRLKMEKTYRMYIAHAPGKTNATSIEAILRAFKKKQSTMPGVDVIIFGHYHKRFIQSGGYFDSQINKFKKILYIINPSPLFGVEYALENGFPPIENGYSIEFYLPIEQDKQPYGIV